MKRLVSVLAVLFAIMIISGLSFAQEGVFRAVHLLNLKSIENEAKLIAMLEDFNKVVAEAGYPKIQYHLWKERGDREGQFKYIFESTWPDQATYDKVHNNEKYQSIFKKYKTRYEELIKEDVYNRYVPLN
jgi:quinol monooxygenase YgiN